jgi:16S rRNA (cytosine1402-N4)-methyltransferase
MKSPTGHKSVMLEEVIEYLAIKPGARVIDATMNGGGHTLGLLEKYSDLKILGIEYDPDIFQEAVLKIKNSDFRGVILVNDSYVNMREIVEGYNFRPDGMVFDLGLSSIHYESGRGFSFMKDEPLDMRFNPQLQTETAAIIVNTYSLKDLEDILTKYGEEKFAPEISEKITVLRKEKPLITTKELVGAIMDSVPVWYKRRKIHPATKTFQALRIAVNREMENVEKGIPAAIDVLNPGGRLVVISFQGLEDKIVREIFKQKAKEGIVRWVVKGTIKPKWDEVKVNPRARSAKMKIIEKI